jgi:hypothetical protein
MNKFREWYLKNSTKITWFLIGMLTFTGLDSLARHDYFNAVLSFVIAYINYYFDKK